MRARSKYSLGVVATQGMSSLSNVILVVVALRNLPPAFFGMFAIGMSLQQLTLGLLRASLGRGVLLDPEPDLAFWRYWGLVLRSVGALAAIGLAACAVGVLVENGGVLFLGVLCALLPLLIVHDLLRYRCFARQEMSRVAIGDVWWLAVCFVLFMGTTSTSPTALYLYWTSGTLVGLALMFPGRRVHGMRIDRSEWVDELRPQMLEFLVGAGTEQVFWVLSPLVLSLADVGMVRAALVPMNLINPLYQASEAAVLPSLRRRVLAGRSISRWVAFIALGGAGVSVALGASVLVAPTAVVQLVFGEGFLLALALVPAAAIYKALHGVLQAYVMGARALGAFNLVLRVRIVQGSLLLGSLLLIRTPEQALHANVWVFGVCSAVWAVMWGRIRSPE